jgi:hypothetical protein
MLAVPHRAELRSRALGAAARILAAIAVAVGMVAVAGRVEDLNLSLLEAIALPAAVLIAAVLYTDRRRRLRRSLADLRRLEADTVSAPAPRVRWAAVLGQGVAVGLVVGAIALVLDIEIDNLAIILAVALGGVAGEEVAGALTVARYEREHGGTVVPRRRPGGHRGGPDPAG